MKNELEHPPGADAAAGLAVWSPIPEEKRDPRVEAGRARRKAVIHGLIGIAIGAAIWLFWSYTVATIAFSVSSLIMLLGLASPLSGFRAVTRFFDALGRVVGRGLSFLTLVPTYYLVFAPLGFFLRRGKNDRMARWLEPDAGTYWSEVSPTSEGVEPYERQF